MSAPSNEVFPVQVVGRQLAAHEVVTLLLAIPGTWNAPSAYRPGQFISLIFSNTRGERLVRFYSLSGIGRADSPWEITLKRQGKVSTYLYDKAAVGTILYATMPQGLFILPQQLAVTQSYMFVAAGTGVTPMLGMLRAIARLPAGQRPQVQLHYGSRTPADIIARQELEKMDPTARWLRQWHYLSSKGQRLTTETVLANAGNLAMRSHWYICGPVTLKDQLVVALARQHVPQTQVHVEVFDQQKPRVPASLAGAPATGMLRVQETGASLDVRGQETMLEALERHGYRPDYSCRVGTCGTCKLQVLAGSATPTGQAILTPADRAAGYVLSCIAHPQGTVTLRSGGYPPRAGIGRATGRQSRFIPATLARITAVAAISGLFLGTWSLTNHRPASWNTVNAAPADTATPGDSGGQPTPTPFDGFPTPTPNSGGGGFNPTPTPGFKPRPTATPRPQPTQPPPPPIATSRPS